MSTADGLLTGEGVMEKEQTHNRQMLNWNHLCRSGPIQDMPFFQLQKKKNHLQKISYNIEYQEPTIGYTGTQSGNDLSPERKEEEYLPPGTRASYAQTNYTASCLIHYHVCLMMRLMITYKQLALKPSKAICSIFSLFNNSRGNEK